MLDTSPFPLSEATLKRIRDLHDEAVVWIIKQLRLRFPEIEADHKAIREDLGYHLEFLNAALEHGYVTSFGEYIAWVKNVSESRGLKTDGLRDSLELLANFYAQRLDDHEFAAVEAVLNAGMACFSRVVISNPSYYSYLPEPLLEVRDFVDALISGQRPSVRQTITRYLADGMPLAAIGVNIIQPAMYEVGRRWQEHRISVAQEHLATTICQTLLFQACDLAGVAEPTGRKALLACVENNHHAIGLSMIADVLEVEGWEVQCLGANTPTGDLLRQVALWQPDVLGLSASLLPQLGAVRAVIEGLQAEFGTSRPTVMVGGLTMNSTEKIWKDVGADLWAPDAKTMLDELA